MRILSTILFMLGIVSSTISQSCLVFDGVDDKITADPTAINTIEENNFTLEAWIQGEDDALTDFPMIFSNRDTENDGMLFFFHRATNKELCIQINGANLKLENNGGYGEILDGDRHHVAITRNLDTIAFYIDGEHIGYKTFWLDNSTLAGDNQLLIGYDKPTGNPFKGNISNVRVWNTHRTQSEIKSTMESQLPANIPNLVMNFPLNEGEGETVVDIATENIAVFGEEGSSDETFPTWDNECLSFTYISEQNYSSISKAFPNPTKENIYIELDDNYKDIMISIYNYSGKKVLEKCFNNSSHFELDLSILPTNNYIISITTESNNSVMKLAVD